MRPHPCYPPRTNPIARSARRTRMTTSHPIRPPLGTMSLRLLVAAALVAVVARFAWTVLGALDVFADYHAFYRAAANLRAGADLYAEGRLLVTRNSYAFWTQTDGQ